MAILFWIGWKLAAFTRETRYIYEFHVLNGQFFSFLLLFSLKKCHIGVVATYLSCLVADQVLCIYQFSCMMFVVIVDDYETIKLELAWKKKW